MRLTPRQVGREQAIVAVQFATIELARALLCTVLCVRREQLRERGEGGPQKIDAHLVAGLDAVLHHREEVQRPERDICLANFANVGE